MRSYLPNYSVMLFQIKKNVEVNMASNGKIALQMAEDTEYNLVLTDIHMPEMNGREFLKNLCA